MRETNPHLRAMNSNNSSGIPHVSHQTGSAKWKAVVNFNGKRYNPCSHDTALEASKAYDVKVRELQREEM